MTGGSQVSDQWAKWLLHRRHGGNEDALRATLEGLYPIRDKVLDHAQLTGHETLLDVGCGDGLIAFGAIQVLPQGRVIFSDISEDLLNHSRQLAQEMGIIERAEFIKLSADNLHTLADESVDVVTTRSVLIYLKDKLRCFKEFYRVLKPGGRLSIFEPINRFGYPEPEHIFWGVDVAPVQELAQKVKALYHSIQHPEDDPMMDFDSHDLLRFAEAAGFNKIYMQLERQVYRGSQPADEPRPDPNRWQRWLNRAPNPKVPTLGEALEQTLTAEERERLQDHMRPRVNNNAVERRGELAYLWALK